MSRHRATVPTPQPWTRTQVAVAAGVVLGIACPPVWLAAADVAPRVVASPVVPEPRSELTGVRTLPTIVAPTPPAQSPVAVPQSTVRHSHAATPVRRSTATTAAAQAIPEPSPSAVVETQVATTPEPTPEPTAAAITATPLAITTPEETAVPTTPSPTTTTATRTRHHR